MRLKRRPRKPSATLRVTAGDRPGVLVVFEPLGSEYVLGPDDEMLVRLYGRSTRAEDTDVEIVHEPQRVVLCLATTYRAWNKAGKELPV